MIVHCSMQRIFNGPDVPGALHQGGTMKTILCVSCLALPGSIRAFCQNGEISPKQGYGYVLFTPGATLGDGVSTTLTIGGGGEGRIKGRFGVGADVSYLFYPRGGFGEGFGLFSPGAFYQFRPAQKTVPFITGGYSLAFRSGTINLVHYGGGLNHWFSSCCGIRFEVRNHTQLRSAEYHLLQFRVGLLLH
jgi:hypothetical protein